MSMYSFKWPKWIFPLIVAWCATQAAENARAQSLLSNLEHEISALVQQGEPAVTSIISYVRESDEKKDDSPLFSLFSSKSSHQPFTRIKIGSGLFFHKSGFIVTRKSVVANACSIRVRIYTGEEMDAELIGIDEEHEVGLLRVPGVRELPHVPFGQPAKLRAGSWIIVMGNSLGVTPAVSVGNVSAVRENGLIQITANIDPGHNGSPVLNANGEIIGMVSGRVDYPVPQQGVYLTASNAALVMPIDQVLDSVKKILEAYSRRHGWLGITVTPNPKDEVHPLVSKIEPGSPADQAGLRPGDVILGFNGQELDHYYALLGLVKKTPPGTATTIRVQREGRELQLAITIGKMDFSRLFSKPLWAEHPAGAKMQAVPLDSRAMLEKRLLEMERQIRELRAKIIKSP
ncbi:MAG: PDZ domain-containing protein [Calditrichaeota bacterium]|nr:MAG: PDZ domain-containing protein [Calditrichota bacterium]